VLAGPIGTTNTHTLDQLFEHESVLGGLPAFRKTGQSCKYSRIQVPVLWEGYWPQKSQKMPGFPSLGYHLASAPEWDRQSNSGVLGADAHSAVVLICYACLGGGT